MSPPKDPKKPAKPTKKAAKKAAKKSVKRAPRKSQDKRALHAVPDAPETSVVPPSEPLADVAAPADPETPIDPYALPEVFDPPFEAHRLRLSGMSWREVAERTGYGNERSALAAVTSYLQKAAVARSAEQQQLALQTEIDRYEAIIHANWIKTMGGDAAAAATVLRAMSQLDRVQRLGEMEVHVVGRTIVVAGTPEEYAATLRAIVEGREDEIPD